MGVEDLASNHSLERNREAGYSDTSCVCELSNKMVIKVENVDRLKMGESLHDEISNNCASACRQ